MTEVESAPAPVITFTGGNPRPEEIAAVVAVLAARGGEPAGSAPPRGGSGWGGYWRRTRRTMRPGPDAWRLSFRL